MKIAIATGIFPPDIGGPASSVPMLANAWTKAGHVVAVVTYSDVKDDGVARPYSVSRVSRRWPAFLRYFIYGLRLFRAARGARTIFAQDAVASGLPAWKISMLRRSRLVIKVVGDFAWEHARVQAGYAGNLEEFQRDPALPFPIKVLRLVQRFIIRRADKVIVPSEYLAGVVRGWGAKAERIQVVYNGVEPVEVPADVQRRPHRIVTAGRLVPWKGFDTLIAAMPKVLERVPDAVLMIIGDGPDERRLRNSVVSLGLEEHVYLVGRLKHPDLLSALMTSGTFALVSSYEGFSHQLVEAFRCGIPVVASRAGGNPELVKDGVNGLLAEYGDVGGTAAALVKLLEDPSAASAMAARAAEDARRFSIEEQIRLTSEAVVGRPGLRVVMVSRDATIADAASRSAGRMRSYGEAVDGLHVVVLARRAAAETRLSEKVTVRIVDIRNPVIGFAAAVRAVTEAARSRDAGLVTAQDPFEAGLVGLIACVRTKRPLVIDLHGDILGPYWKDESGTNRLLSMFGSMIIRSASGVRAVSAKVADEVRLAFPEKPLVKVPVFTERLDCRTSAKPWIFGYVGRFTGEKNLPGLFAAFRSVVGPIPEARLLMVGHGPLENELRATAAEYGVGGKVEWRDYSEDVASVYARIGTLVLPSWHEGWGRVAVEALQCGIPVVMTDVGCAGEVVRNGLEGRVVPVGDAEALARAMESAAEPANHQRMSEAALKRASELESPEELVRRLTDFWKKIGSL